MKGLIDDRVFDLVEHVDRDEIQIKRTLRADTFAKLSKFNWIEARESVCGCTRALKSHKYTSRPEVLLPTYAQHLPDYYTYRALGPKVEGLSQNESQGRIMRLLVRLGLRCINVIRP